MILVDITVPALDNTYDFRLDEDATVAEIMDEVVSMICQKEMSHLEGDEKDLLLCSQSGQVILDRAWTLRESGVRSGERLLLV
ncbi:MAG: EsaB/YukD family protein [Lachnospiraceae bacterium]|nr:EsaB/YukD family protein [Lachnospiraceae bacterium]